MKIDLEKCIHCNKKATQGGMYCDDHRKIAWKNTLKKAAQLKGNKEKGINPQPNQ